MSKALKQKLQRAEDRHSRARDAIYNFAAPRNDVPFSQCMAMATPEAIAELRAAQDSIRSIENEAIDKRKAWRAESGLLFWY